MFTILRPELKFVALTESKIVEKPTSLCSMSPELLVKVEHFANTYFDQD
jgi:hypothetical protein